MNYFDFSKNCLNTKLRSVKGYQKMDLFVITSLNPQQSLVTAYQFVLYKTNVSL